MIFLLTLAVVISSQYKVTGTDWGENGDSIPANTIICRCGKVFKHCCCKGLNHPCCLFVVLNSKCGLGHSIVIIVVDIAVVMLGRNYTTIDKLFFVCTIIVGSDLTIHQFEGRCDIMLH